MSIKRINRAVHKTRNFTQIENDTLGWCFHEIAVPEDERSNRTRWKPPTVRETRPDGNTARRKPDRTGTQPVFSKEQSDSKENQNKTDKVHVSDDEILDEDIEPSLLNTNPHHHPNAAAPSSPAWVPSWEEVEEWADEKKWPREKAAEFFNYYDALGWEVKGSKLKNWRAKAQSWLNRWREEKAKKSQPANCNLS